MREATTGATAEERLARFIDVQQLLFEVSREIGPALELEPVLDVVLRAMRRLVAFKGGSICLVEGDAIRLVASDPAVTDDVRALRLPVGQGLSGRIVASGEPLLSNDLAADDRVDKSVLATGSNATMRSFMGVPLMVLGEVIGLLQVDSAEVGAFTDDDVYVLAGLGAQVAGAIESARRYEAVLELERLKSDFIERVSHELRTPITIMSGFASTLAEQGADLSEEQRRIFIERLASASDRLRYLVEEILTLASLDSGLATPTPVELPLEPLLEDLVRETAVGAPVELECPTDLRIRTDPSVLTRVVGPVVDNAIRYAGSAKVRAYRDGAAVVVEVSDDGPGIPVELRPRIFDRFVRGRHTVAGMGLGLAIAQHLGAAIDATISYEPRDPGSCFAVRFPDLVLVTRPR